VHRAHCLIKQCVLSESHETSTVRLGTGGLAAPWLSDLFRFLSCPRHYFHNCQVYNYRFRRYSILSCIVLTGKHETSSFLSALIALPYKGTGLWGSSGRKGWMAIIVGLLTFLPEGKQLFSHDIIISRTEQSDDQTIDCRCSFCLTVKSSEEDRMPRQAVRASAVARRLKLVLARCCSGNSNPYSELLWALRNES
jgi:hypothetical protein